MGRMHTTRILGSQSEDEVDSEAVTVRTPNLPPIVQEEEAPFPLVRPPLSVSTTQRIAAQQPLSLRAPASREHESSWFEKEPPPFVAPGVPEVAEPPSASLDGRRGFVAPSTRGVGVAMVALLLAGVVAAGSFFFLSARSASEAKVPDQATTTQITNAELPPPAIEPAPPPAVAPAPEVTTTGKPVITTVRTSDLPDSRIDRRKATTPATDPDLRPDDATKNNRENTIPTPSPDSPSTPPDLEEKR